jgi:hypothetical protein
MPFKKINRFADRGAVAEKAVMAYLVKWMAAEPAREFERLVDSKAAGRTIKAAAADFDFHCLDSRGFGCSGLIEVKETQHEYRLARDKVPQLPRLRRRARCGGLCIVLVLHSTTGQWKALTSAWMEFNGDKGSWNLKELPAFDTPYGALNHLYPEVFR